MNISGLTGLGLGLGIGLACDEVLSRGVLRYVLTSNLYTATQWVMIYMFDDKLYCPRVFKG